MRYLFFAVVLLSGCADLGTAFLPETKVTKNDFDGSMHVKQPPISSVASMSEAWHQLGFEWQQSTPDVVYITAGIIGAQSIMGLEFNADSKHIVAAQASNMTDIEPGASAVSYRRFSVPWDDFQRIATSQTVKVKFVSINDYTLSSFSQDPQNSFKTRMAQFNQAASNIRKR